MREAGPVVLSLVERGWQAARECSLDVERRGITVIHLIKGSLSGAVRRLIAPRPNIRTLSVPRPLFWVGVGLGIVVCWATGRLRSVLVDNDRSAQRLHRWTRWTGAQVVKAQPGPDGYELWIGQQPVPRAAMASALGHADRVAV